MKYRDSAANRGILAEVDEFKSRHLGSWTKVLGQVQFAAYAQTEECILEHALKGVAGKRELYQTPLLAATGHRIHLQAPS